MSPRNCYCECYANFNRIFKESLESLLANDDTSKRSTKPNCSRTQSGTEYDIRGARARARAGSDGERLSKRVILSFRDRQLSTAPSPVLERHSRLFQ